MYRFLLQINKGFMLCLSRNVADPDKATANFNLSLIRLFPSSLNLAPLFEKNFLYRKRLRIFLHLIF